MKTLRRPRAVPARSHARGVPRRRPPLGAVAREVEVPLPAALRKDARLGGGSVALVDVEGDRLKLRFLRSALGEAPGSGLSAPEAEALARGGVDPVSGQELGAVEARTASAYRQLRSDSLTVDEAARRLGVNTSRVRQRLGER